MPEGSGRTGNPGNQANRVSTGRSGLAGNSDGMHYKPKRPGSMQQSSSIAGRSLRPGNDSSLQLPSNAPGTMQSKTGKPDSSGILGHSKGKFNYASSKGLLKR